MKYTHFLGLLGAAWIVGGGIIGHMANPEIFLDSHALLLVFGGTVVTTMISVPVSQIVSLGRFFMYGFMLKKNTSNTSVVQSLVGASAAVTSHSAAAANGKRVQFVTATHPFVHEGLQLIAEGVLSEKDLQDVLVKRSLSFKKTYAGDAKTLTALAKYPPAFGLLGASTGMISMMSGLGRVGQDSIGPAMAIALVATFWGVAFANFILLPLADYAQKLATDDVSSRQIMIEGLKMIKRRETTQTVLEKLASFLPQKERNNAKFKEWKNTVLSETAKRSDHVVSYNKAA